MFCCMLQVVYVPVQVRHLDAMQRELAQQRERQILSHGAQMDTELNLPPAIPISDDGEEGYIPYDKRISQGGVSIRPPPNKTVFQGESPPPYRSNSISKLEGQKHSQRSSLTANWLHTGSSGSSSPLIGRCYSMSCDRSPDGSPGYVVTASSSHPHHHHHHHHLKSVCCTNNNNHKLRVSGGTTPQLSVMTPLHSHPTMATGISPPRNSPSFCSSTSAPTTAATIPLQNQQRLGKNGAVNATTPGYKAKPQAHRTAPSAEALPKYSDVITAGTGGNISRPLGGQGTNNSTTSSASPSSMPVDTAGVS